MRAKKVLVASFTAELHLEGGQLWLKFPEDLTAAPRRLTLAQAREWLADTGPANAELLAAPPFHLKAVA